MKRVRAFQLLEYAVVRFLLAAILSLGHERAAGAARAIGELVFRLDGKHRRRALTNVRAAWPGLPEKAVDRMARGAFRSFLLSVVETAYLPRLLTRGSLARRVEMVVDPEARAVLAGGGGAIFTTAHIGNWEVSGVVGPAFGVPLVSVARPLTNRYMDRYLVGIRERRGQKIVAKSGAVKELVKEIRNGRYPVLLVDQDARRRGIFVEYFDRPASTTPAPATLAIRYGMPILPTWQRRVGKGFKHVITIERPLTAPATGDRERDVWLLTQEITKRVEAWVREVPDQWLWGHRRWKTRPEDPDSWRPNHSTFAA
jgi:KDO2-lipid IV(A) lauroyltransferase